MEDCVEFREHGARYRSVLRPHVRERAAHRVVSVQIELWREYEAIFAWLFLILLIFP